VAVTPASVEARVNGASSTERYMIISADTHAVVPKDVFRPYVEARHREAFEREVRGAEAERAACREGYRPFLAHRPEPTEEERYQAWNRAAEAAEAGRCWEPGNWLVMNEAEGVVATVVYPAGTASRPPWEGFVQPVTDPELRDAGRRVYNRWLADFCAESPDRLAGVAVLPSLDDIAGVVREVEWAAEVGLRGGVWLSPTMPTDRPGWHLPHYDPLWAACQDHELPVNFHIDFGGGPPANTILYGTGPEAWAIQFHDAPPTYRALWFLILGGVFERFPRLRVCFTEQLARWIPHELRRLQDVFTDRSFTAVNRLRPVREKLSLTPREYWHRNCFVGASFMCRDEAEQRDEIGIDNIMWGSDFPHPEGTTPVTIESLRSTFAGVPPQELRRILGENAASVYRFDVEQLRSIADRVGPTYAEIAEPLPDPPAEYPDKLAFGRGLF
jgi:predicted TIM-barrel fold metal-dependent hydrolase